MSGPLDPVRVGMVVATARKRFFKESMLSRVSEAATFENPLDSLCALEESRSMETELAGGSEAARALAFDAYREFHDGWMEWLFAAGPHPADVMKRLYTYAKRKNPGLVWNMSFRAFGELFGETHATAKARDKALFGTLPAGWSKPDGACKAMRAAQKGNGNRAGGRNGQRQSSFLRKLKTKKNE